MINKRLITLFIIVNSLYLLYFILLMIWLKQPLITDVSRQPVSLSNEVITVIQIVMSALSFFIFVGLAMVLKKFREHLWIIISVWLYIIVQLYLNILSILSINHVASLHVYISGILYINYGVLLYLVISFLFVNNTLIKDHYRLFGTGVLISIILVRITPLLYDNFGLKWALINPGVIKIIPFIISLLLFIKLAKAINQKLI